MQRETMREREKTCMKNALLWKLIRGCFFCSRNTVWVGGKWHLCWGDRIVHSCEKLRRGVRLRNLRLTTNWVGDNEKLTIASPETPLHCKRKLFVRRDPLNHISKNGKLRRRVCARGQHAKSRATKFLHFAIAIIALGCEAQNKKHDDSWNERQKYSTRHSVNGNSHQKAL